MHDKFSSRKNSKFIFVRKCNVNGIDRLLSSAFSNIPISKHDFPLNWKIFCFYFFFFFCDESTVSLGKFPWYAKCKMIFLIRDLIFEEDEGWFGEIQKLHSIDQVQKKSVQFSSSVKISPIFKFRKSQSNFQVQ